MIFPTQIWLMSSSESCQISCQILWPSRERQTWQLKLHTYMAQNAVVQKWFSFYLFTSYWPGQNAVESLYLLIPPPTSHGARIKSRSACISLIKSVNVITLAVADCEWLLVCAIPDCPFRIGSAREARVCQHCGHSPNGFQLETIMDLNKFAKWIPDQTLVQLNFN